MHESTRILREEHETILRMLDVLETTAEKVEAGESVPVSLLSDLVEFFTLFADRSHHGKEEDLLFPLLERKGVPRIGGPVGCMLVEHDEGRQFVKAMVASAPGCASGEASARKTWVEAARGYANLLCNHIWKENEILFLMAEKLLSEEEQAQLAAEFRKVGEAKIGAGTEGRLREQVEKLTQSLAAGRN